MALKQVLTNEQCGSDNRTSEASVCRVTALKYTHTSSLLVTFSTGNQRTNCASSETLIRMPFFRLAETTVDLLLGEQKKTEQMSWRAKTN